MTSPVPQPIAMKSSTQNNEVSIATSISDVNRFFQPRIFRTSRNSPPDIVDVDERTLVFDITALRLYTKISGTLRYVQFT